MIERFLLLIGLVLHKLKLSAANREMVVAGEYDVDRATIIADPFGRYAR